jgi:ubiquinone/menaquinone biosynthesis C-methylase UbiE
MNWGWISLDALLYSVIRFVIIVLFTSSDVAGKGMNANPMAGSEGSTYVMGRTSEEYERLRHQAELLESITGSVLDRVGLCSGMRCLDVGCGPGEVMRLMAERVGPTGHVLGMDVDGKLGREALAVLTRKGYGQCSFIEGNVDRLEQILSDRFDLVFTRILLMHLDDPILALRKMYSQVKPGGRIVVQEYYFLRDSDPAIEALAEFNKVFFGVYDKEGRETRIGIKLPGLFIEARIGPPDGTDVTGSLLPSPVGAKMLAAVYRSVLPLALKHGLTTEQRSGWFFEEMQTLERTNYYMLWPLLVSAWKQKAAESYPPS